DPAGEDEVAAVTPAEVDLARPEVVREADQVLGRIDYVVRDTEGPADDVGRAAGKDGDRHVGPCQAVCDLVEGAVTAEGDHEVVTAGPRLAADLDRVLRRLGVDRLDVVASLERVDDQVLEPIRDRRRVRVDDD